VNSTSPRRRHHLAVARIAAIFLMVLLMHWIGPFGIGYFLLLGAGALLLLVSQVPALAWPKSLHTLATDDRLGFWIILAVLAVIGYLHNANQWLPDGALNRPADVAMWKTELVLGIALTVPLARWLLASLSPAWGKTGGRYFAREFALYVNFSGVAIILWTGDAVLSTTSLAALLALAVLAELTLRADD
jgi:hypothetical protein